MLKKALYAIIRLVFPAPQLEEHVASFDSSEFFKRAQQRHNDSIVKNPKILSPFVFRDPIVRTAVHVAKYRGQKGVCRMLGDVLWNMYGEDISSHALISNVAWVVVPIPLSSKKLRERGYNQAEEIAKGFLACADARIFALRSHALSRVTSRDSQARTLSKKERTKNVSGSFLASSDEVCAKNILLIDDVVTTGATLKEAAHALRKSGARRILCITVAH